MADISCIKNDSVDFFYYFFTSLLWIVLVCIVFYMHLTSFLPFLNEAIRGFF